jgi:hypothetical protein
MKIPPPPGLIAKLIGSGTRNTHLGSVATVIKIARKIMTDTPQSKVVVIGKFIDQLDFIASSLEEFGVVQLDGRTKNRLQVLDMFQEPSVDIRVIVTSAQVGGVGVNLDDQDGNFPRHMLILPSYECIDMIQCIGRIYRSNTKSEANVTVVYNNQISCPIKNCLEVKSKVIQGISSKSLIPDLSEFGVFKEAITTQPPKEDAPKEPKIYKEYSDEMPKKHVKQLEATRVLKQLLLLEIKSL